MNLKFLPIGTVCLVNSISKKQMIIGYSKSGYDYIAVEYPKGFESDMKLSYFNHDEVKELYSLGYKNEESRIFNGTLVSVLTSNILDKELSEEKEDSSLNVLQEAHPVEELKVEETFDSSSLSVFHDPQLESSPIVEEKEDFIEEKKIEKLPELDSEEDIGEETKLDVEQVPLEVGSVKLQDDGVILSGGVKIGRILKTTDRLRGIIMADEEEEKEEPMEEIEQKEDFPLEQVEEIPFENKVEEIPAFEEKVPSEFISGIEELDQIQDQEESSVEVTNIDIENDLPLDDETVDISTMVKKIEETISEKEEEEDSQKKKPKKKKKKEKWGLFHFGKK